MSNVTPALVQGWENEEEVTNGGQSCILLAQQVICTLCACQANQGTAGQCITVGQPTIQCSQKGLKLTIHVLK